MALTDTEEITKRAYRVVSALDDLPVQRQQEVLIMATLLVNMEAARAQQQLQQLQMGQLILPPRPDPENLQ